MEDVPALRARAAELERVLGELRARLMTLARVLPVEFLPYVEGLITYEDDATFDLIYGGLSDGVELTPTDVATEMQGLWKRMAPPAGPR